MVHKVNIFLINIVLTACIIYGPITAVEYEKKYLHNFELLHPDYNNDTIIVDKYLEDQKHSYIVFIKDNKNNHYLIKQERSISLIAQFRSVTEMLGSYMATTAGIPSQEVRLLPVGIHFPGKFLMGMPATIHSVMPGSTISAQKIGPYKNVYIKQNNQIDIPFESSGLSERVIKGMSKHPDLAPIVALDTFVGNRDRNRKNVLYDIVENRFYAIDNGFIYIHKQGELSLAQIACQQVEFMIAKKRKFNYKRYNALKKYQETLKILVFLFPPEKTCALLHKFIDESGLHNHYGLSNNHFLSIVQAYEQEISRTYIEIIKLIALLAEFLEQ